MGETFSDQTGCFPIILSKENKYILIMHDYDSNAILGEAMKSRAEAEIVRAFTNMYKLFKDKRHKVVMHRLDNEFLVAFKLI